MKLWTAYEGRTIDGAFPLTRLLRPEGSSAFFTTSDGVGLPRGLRLIESRHGEADILSRWRGVAALDHPNILKLEEYGQVVVDETSLVYAVMEPVDANLGEVLSGQRLTVPDTKQIAVSLLRVLEALHSHGFIHEHVEPVNVVAVNEVVKLQCDCIREAPEGERGRELKKQDIYDLSVLLLQALTRERTLEAAAGDLPLPAPFDQIVSKGMSGEWGLVEIAAALEESSAPQDASPIGSSSEAPVAAALPNSLPGPETAGTNMVKDTSSADRDLVSARNEIRSSGPRVGLIAVVIGLAVSLVIGSAWYRLRERPPGPSGRIQETSTPGVDSDAKGPTPGIAVGEANNASPVQQNETAPVSGQWRVIAYTYNREGQAKKKAARIAQRHPELRPEVFRPNGTGPYLVTVGGAMGRDEAFALAKEARSHGLPGDIYAQNYSGRQR